MSHPGKLITLRALEGQKPLPYGDGVAEVLIIADTSNNRFVVLDAQTNTFIEQIGSGKVGYKEGSFSEA